MFHYIYSRPLIAIVIFIVTVLIIWSMLSVHISVKYWWHGNTILTLLALLAIFYATLFNRSKGTTGLIFVPFSALTAAQQQPELYREMLMNVFLFFPLGLALSNAGAESLSRHLSAAFSALALSTPSTAMPSGWRKWTM